LRRHARRALFSGESSNGNGHGLVHAVPVMRWQMVEAVLVGRAARPGIEKRCKVLLEAAAAAVQPALEKDMLLRRNIEREHSLLESSERRFTRFGFDLHDGAIQDIAALAGDVRLFRGQLGETLDDSDRKPLLVGRLDDVEARLVALDQDLRELARSFESPSFLKRPFREVLQREIAAFDRRGDARATLDVRGDLAQLTASQRIAVLRIVQESLANVREHSGASQVDVCVVARRGAVQASIRDNGQGFDVERRLLRAAGHGRLGLVGMSERVRLLGGAFDVQSAPGGPTTVSVSLPEWRPVGAREARRGA
jgi:signal transduction histidine kinase